MSDFIFVHLIDKSPVGTELGRSIPLHMTALRWFESDRPQQEIVDATELALQSIGKIVATATCKDMFGADEDVPVMRLGMTNKLSLLHNVLRAAMEGIGATMNERWTGDQQWSPHVSDKPGQQLQIGEEVTIADVDLITRSIETGNRTILHRFNLEA